MKKECTESAQRTPSSGHTQQHLHLRRKVLAVVVAACFNVAQANPVSPQVIAGQASFNQQGKLFSITNTPNTIINWSAFSINPDEITRFIQQGADSKVLNRITGQDPSQILGALQSNGKVFLINPNGVLFGQGSRVDVNGLVASSLALSDSDFLAGKNSFSAGAVAGKVSNQGTITTPSGGQVYLIASSVDNSGLITAPNGDVVLAAGRSVQLVDSSNPDVRVVLAAPADQAMNLGQVIAQGGRIGIYGALVNQRGTVNANSAVLGDHGQIILKASGTTLLEAGSVTSATGVGGGGQVEVLGQQVGLTGNARVDASGQSGGGTVLIGGDYHGANAAVQNANFTFVGSDALIAADAGQQGQGGKVIVWSEQASRVHGGISARGGALGGDGGFVETSGAYLDTAGIKVSTVAAHGHAGQWLLDPLNIQVIAGEGSTTPGDAADFDSGPATGTSTVAASSLSGSGDVTLEAKNDITFSSAISKSSSYGLTARAGHDINVSAGISTAGGDVSLTANDAGGTANGTGAVKINAGGAIATSNGDIYLSGASITVGANLNAGTGMLGLSSSVANKSVVVNSGATLTAGDTEIVADNMSLNGAINTSFITLDTFSNAVPIQVGSSAVTSNTSILGLTANSLLSISASEIDIGTRSGYTGALSVAGTLDLKNNGTAASDTLLLQGGSVAVNGPVLVAHNLGMIASGAITQTTSGILTGDFLFAEGSAVTLKSANVVPEVTGKSTSGDFQFSNVGNLTVVENQNRSLDGINSSTHNIVLSSTGNISQDGSYGYVIGSKLTLSTPGSVSFSSGTNQINELQATGVHSLQYNQLVGEGGLLVDGASLSSSGGGDRSLSISTNGTLTVAGAVNSSNASLVLSGSSVHVNNVAVTGGTSTTLSAGDTITLDAGANVTSSGTTTLHGGGITLGAGSTATATGSLTMMADIMSLSSTANVGGASVTFTPYSSGHSISLGSGASSSGGEGGSLGLTDTVLKNVTTSNLNIGEGSGTVIISGLLDLTGSTKFTGDLSLSTTGQILAQHNIAVPGKLTLVGNTGVSNSAALSGQSVQLSSDNIVLNSGTSIVADGGVSGNGTIWIQPSTSSHAIDLGSSDPSDGSGLRFSPTALGTLSASKMQFTSSGGLTVSQPLTLSGVALGLYGGTAGIVINSALTARTLQLSGDTMSITAPITADLANLTTSSSNWPITVGDVSTAGSCGQACLALSDLRYLNIPTIGIGSSEHASPISVAGMAYVLNSTDPTALNVLTTRIGLLTSAGVTQSGPIVVQDLGIEAGATVLLNNSSNAVNNLALMQTAGDFTFKNSSDLAIARLKGGVATSDLIYDVNGITNSGTGNVTLQVADGALTRGATGTGNGVITAHNLILTTGNGVGTASVPLVTSIVSLSVENSADGGTSPINIKNTDQGSGTTTMTVNRAVQSDKGSPNGGAIAIDNTGPMVIGEGGVATGTGSITLATHSPLTIQGPVTSGSGAITLSAGPGGSNDVLTIASGITVSTTGPIVLNAGGNIANDGDLSHTPTVNGNQNVVAAPSLSDCVANPAISGCSAVLPALSACVAAPTAAGCSAVLPSVATCTAAPTTAGCSVVLPALSVCASAPTTAGCTAVLPTVAVCLAAPTTAGCSAVLPSLAVCAATPTLAGCAAVLPSLASCIAAPSAAGCASVLPSLSSCVAAPATAGCSAVLPSVTACAATPTAAGCSAVLPSLAICVSAPTTAGCSAVLPSLASCVSSPSTAGCSSVLPSLASCVAAPSAAGCSAVLPSLAACVANPGSAGCAAVLPSLASCVATPTLSGCATVLPSLTQCTSTPTLAGCSAVLPPVASCTSNPSAAGCQSVLPPVTTQQASTTPLSQALNSTVTLINTTTSINHVSTTVLVQSTPSSSSGGGSGTSGGNSGTSSTPTDDSKTKDEKTVTTTDSKPGASNDTAKKMYCN